MTCPTAFHHLDICANVIEILVITPPFNIFAQCSVTIRKILINLWHIAIWRDMTLIPGPYEMKNRWNYWFLFHKTDYAFFNVSKQNWSVTSGHKHRELAVGLWGYIQKMDLTCSLLNFKWGHKQCCGANRGMGNQSCWVRSVLRPNSCNMHIINHYAHF